MRLPDRVTGLFLVGLGGASAYGGWQLPPADIPPIPIDGTAAPDGARRLA